MEPMAARPTVETRSMLAPSSVGFKNYVKRTRPPSRTHPSAAPFPSKKTDDTSVSHLGPVTHNYPFSLRCINQKKENI